MPDTPAETTRGESHDDYFSLDEMPHAIERLEATISDEAKAELVLEALYRSHGGQRDSGSGLSLRAWPFLDTMRKAREHEGRVRRAVAGGSPSAPNATSDVSKASPRDGSDRERLLRLDAPHGPLAGKS